MPLSNSEQHLFIVLRIGRVVFALAHKLRVLFARRAFPESWQVDVLEGIFELFLAFMALIKHPIRSPGHDGPLLFNDSSFYV